MYIIGRFELPQNMLNVQPTMQSESLHVLAEEHSSTYKFIKDTTFIVSFCL